MAAPGQRCQNSGSPSPASDDADLQPASQSQSVCLPPAVARIADAWPLLPLHIREAIQTLVDAALPVDQARSPSGRAMGRESIIEDEAAWRMAQECRSIVQACLREEEWQDADREFFGVIREGLAAVEPRL